MAIVSKPLKLLEAQELLLVGSACRLKGDSLLTFRPRNGDRSFSAPEPRVGV